jgi:hypothetical protein
MTDVHVAEPSEGWVFSWVLSSLRQGGKVAQQLAGVVGELRGRVRVLLPKGLSPETLNPREGGNVQSNETNALLASLLGEFRSFQPAFVYVEDDLRRLGDPALDQEGAKWFTIDGEVIHWMDLLGEPTAQLVGSIRRSSSGYLLNAFVASIQPPSEHGQTGDKFVAGIASSLAAVIVSVFDAESFAVWDAGEAV